jgi:phosphohistidine swiveling domain-containing protein
MNQKELIKIIKKDTWWSEECPGVPLFCQWMRQFVEQSRYWHPRLPKAIFCFIKKDFIYEETPEKQKIKIWDYVWRRSTKNWSYQTKRYLAWRRLVVKIEKQTELFDKETKNLTNFQLADSFSRFSDLVRDHWRYTWVQESADVFSTEVLPGLVKNELKINEGDKLNEIMIVLAAPRQLSFMEEEYLSLLDLAIDWHSAITKIKALNKAPQKLQTAVVALAAKYIWLLSNYREGHPFTPAAVWEQLRYACQKKTRRDLKLEFNSLKTKLRRSSIQGAIVLRKYKISAKLRSIFKLLAWWAGWIDERKRLALKANWYLEKYAAEISLHLKRPLWQIKYMTTEEAVSGLRAGVMPTPIELAKRRKFSVYAVVKNGGRVKDEFITGRKAKQLWRTVFKDQSREIKGQVASAPMDALSGVAQVVLDPHRDKFISGRILVTTMTRPDFVPLMRRAKAIITDEGGITSHAAIISRELGIPCIIGTKVGTKLIATGKLVVLNLSNGRVIIK